MREDEEKQRMMDLYTSGKVTESVYNWACSIELGKETATPFILDMQLLADGFKGVVFLRTPTLGIWAMSLPTTAIGEE